MYNGDIFEQLRLSMYQAGITSERSVLMFLCTIGVESGYGERTIEYEYKEGYNDKSYTFETRGAGLIQITGETQISFLQYIKTVIDDKNKINEIDNYINGSRIRKNANGQEQVYNVYGNIAQYIADNYAIESATWYWGIQKRCNYSYVKDGMETVQALSINEYIDEFENANMDNVFLVIQYYVNRQRWKDPQPQNMCNTIEDIEPYKGEKEDYWVNFADTNALAPNGWEQRKGDWDKAKDLMGVEK